MVKLKSACQNSRGKPANKYILLIPVYILQSPAYKYIHPVTPVYIQPSIYTPDTP